MSKTAAAPKFETLVDDFQMVRKEIRKFLLGQDRVIDLTLTSILAGGHAVLVGLPGLGKTRLVHTVSTVLGLDTRRIQCTPDLMPADILGSEILQEDAKGQRHFKFLQGPVFCQLLMADEINRASPRTQSALLEAMQEKRVTIAGHSHDLPKPFHVLATQNPLEQEGTYPLPEAQRDRFLMQIDITYPDFADEKTMVLATTSGQEDAVKTLFTSDQLMSLQDHIREMPLGDDVLETAIHLVTSLRPESGKDNPLKQMIAWGPGPRASQTLIQTAKSYAFLNGRTAPAVEDIKTLAVPVLKHRMELNLSARADGKTVDDLIQNAVDAL